MGKGSGLCARPALELNETQAYSAKLIYPQTEYQKLLYRHRNDPALQSARQIALDVDETVFPLIPTIQSLGGDISYKTHTYWTALRELLGGKEKAFTYVDQATKYENAIKLGTFKGVSEALHELKAYGVDIHIMTHRPPDRYKDTERFLKKMGIPFDSLEVSYDLDKVARCHEMGIGVLVDDKPETIEEAKAAGMEVMSLAYHYNRELLKELEVPYATNWNCLKGMVLDGVGKQVASRLTGDAV